MSKEILYICDGKMEGCNGNDCYWNGGRCYHTPDVRHAKNFHHSGKDGELWEDDSTERFLSKVIILEDYKCRAIFI